MLRRTRVAWAFSMVAMALALALALASPGADQGGGPANAPGQAGEPERPTTRLSVSGTLDVKMELVRLPGGAITLRDKHRKETTHRIKPFWIGKYEVRWAEYAPFWQRADLTPEQRRDHDDAESRPSRPYSLPHRGDNDACPACGVAYRPAVNYCKWLGERNGRALRLPTEAEWEYACRAGRPAAPDEKPLKADELSPMAWFIGNSDDMNHEVGLKRPNAWGLHDMLGNVAEWVIVNPDAKGPMMKGYSDKAHPGADFAVVAGGSFQDDAENVHPRAREAYAPAWQRNDPQDPRSPWWMCNAFHVGFRVVMEEQ